MALPLLTELPYQPDSARLFEAIADLPWAVFLDSGRHHPAQSRYDILSAQPYVRLVTRGPLTEIYSDTIELSREDPFSLLRRALAIDPGNGDANYNYGVLLVVTGRVTAARQRLGAACDARVSAACRLLSELAKSR